jgi:hypothetical protein
MLGFSPLFQQIDDEEWRVFPIGDYTTSFYLLRIVPEVN